tara:strand:- start:208 stop:579 length:372 start_codon:yes stop_codon:yes gene_type:complete
MSLPTFSQNDTPTNLVCLPTEQARLVVTDLTAYDFCHQERDSLKAEINDLYNIIEQDSLLLKVYQISTDSLILLNKECYNQNINLNLDLDSKDKKIKSLKSTRNITILTTLASILTPILLSKN